MRALAISELGQLGAKSRAAVPALLQLLRDEKYDPAAAKAPVKDFPTVKIKTRGGFADKEPFPPNLAVWITGTFSTANLAASALWIIDPAAAAKAHLKRPE
jgi:hypothetical protein